MRLGGYVDDVDRVFLLSQTAGGQPWALAALLAVIDTYQREHITEQLHSIGADLRMGITDVVAEAGLSSYFQLRGRDCNLVYTARDAQGRPSQEFRTLVLQEFLECGVMAPSFVVNVAHDPKAICQTVDAVAELMPPTSGPLRTAFLRCFTAGQSGRPSGDADRRGQLLAYRGYYAEGPEGQSRTSYS